MNTQGAVGEPVRWQIVTCCSCAASTCGVVSIPTNEMMSTQGHRVAIPDGNGFKSSVAQQHGACHATRTWSARWQKPRRPRESDFRRAHLHGMPAGGAVGLWKTEVLDLQCP